MTSLKTPYAPPSWLMGLSTGTAVMGITLITPALPLISAEMEVGANTVQFLFTSYLIMLAASQLVIGPFSDLIGRRPFILAGALLIAIGGGFTILADNITTLTVGRVIQGLGAGACISMARAMINDSFDRQQAARKMASVQSIQAIVPIIALMSGGAIVMQFGWVGVMWMIFCAGVILTVSLPLLLRETFFDTKPTLNLKAIGTAYLHVLKIPVFLGFTVISSTQVGMFFAMNAFLPYRYAELGISPMEFGFWFGLTPVAYLLGNLANRYFFVNLGIERAVLIGCVLCCFSLILLFACQYIGITSVLGLALPCSLFGFSNGLTIANTVIGGIKSAGQYAGTGSGIIGALQMITGSLLGSIIILLGGDSNIVLACTIVLLSGILSMIVAVMVYRINTNEATA
jgi:DHA1 family bicyclomycin/chloramphenicol resistance-like MFS transporter